MAYFKGKCCSLVLLSSLIFFAFSQTEWTGQISPSQENLNSITATQTGYVAVGESGTIITSSDGIEWTSAESGTTNNLRKVLWAENKLIVVGDDGTILTSNDGIQWNSISSGTTWDLYSICFTGNTYVAVGGGTGRGKIYTSKDMTSWVEQNDDDIYAYLLAVIWNGSRLVSAGQYGIYTSTDEGTSWTETCSHDHFLFDICWSGSRFVAVGSILQHSVSGDYTVFSSKDGIKWDTLVDINSDLKGVVYGDNQYVAVGSKDILCSKDGITWENKVSENLYLNDVAFSNHQFVAVGEGGLILTSVSDNQAGNKKEEETDRIERTTFFSMKNGSVNIRSGLLEQGQAVHWEICSISGKKIIGRTQQTETGILPISIENLPSGVYILHIYNKIIKESFSFYKFN